VVAVVAYILLLVGLAVTGHFGFVPKEFIIPAFLVVPAVAGRVRPFLSDWGVFIGLVILFDALRGLIYSLILTFDLPVHMNYAIAGDRMILGDTLPAHLQRHFLPPQPGFFEKLLVVIHASHFVLFLMYALALWLWRPDAFRSFARAFVVLIYCGLIGYLLIPTVPPWMAASGFEVIPPLRHVTSEIYNTVMPRVAEGFDINPIAAMPSLHTAIPLLLVLESLRVRAPKYVTAFVALYGLGVIMAITYLGEHYLVDVLAGALLAFAVFFVVHRNFEPQPKSARPLERTLLYTALLVCFTIGVARSRLELGMDWVPSEAFVARELKDRSPVYDYYRGYHAYQHGDWKQTIEAFSKLPERRRYDHILRMEAEARAADGDLDGAIGELRGWAERKPNLPDPIFWQARVLLKYKRATPSDIEAAAQKLISMGGDGPSLANQLRDLVR
jgi:hypothetical protein